MTCLQMVAAGWTYDPSPEYDDGVTCMYCNLSLDGWEPKDDPYAEHQKRCPDCPFFNLVDEWADARKQAKGHKGKGRASRGSKTSRLSTQSIASVASEAPSQLSLGDLDEPAAEEDSVLTTATNATSTSTTGKGRKKTAAKGAKKGTRGKKTTADESATDIDPPTQPEETTVIEAPAKLTRKASRSKTAPVIQDSLMMEIDPPAQIEYPSIGEEPPKRQTRRKASRTEQPGPIEETLNASQSKRPARGRPAKGKQQVRMSDDESQLHSELQAAVESSMISTQQMTRSTRGTKRTSDGAPKVVSSVIVLNEGPVELQSQQAKPKRGRKPKAAANKAESEDDPQPRSSEVPQRVSSLPKALPKSRKGKKAAKIAEPEPEPEVEVEPEVPQDTKMEEAPAMSQDAVEALEAENDDDYFDFAQSIANPINPYAPITGTPDHGPGDASPAPSTPTPARTRQTPASIRPLSSVPQSSARRPEPHRTTTPISSPNSSDVENKPPSSRPASARPPLSVQRIPLAAGTPNRQLLLSPSKRPINGGLKSALPWSPTDLENVFLNSPVKRNLGLSETAAAADIAHTLHMKGVDIEHLNSSTRLKEVVTKVKGALKSEEKQMTVEQWVRWNAQVGEERLRRECEGLVMVFEKEGGRALRCLEGVECAAL
jgi:hypothetical protein